MAIAYDNVASLASGISPTSPFSFNHTSAGTSRLVDVTVIHTGGTITGVTYGGVAMSFIRSDTNGSTIVERWHLEGQASGTNSVSISFTGGPTVVIAGAISLTGAKQTSQPDNHNGGTGTFTNPSVAVVTSADNSMVIDGFGWSGSATGSVGAGQLQKYQLGDAFSFGHLVGSIEGPKTPAGSVSMDWTATNVNWAGGAVSYAPLNDPVQRTKTFTADGIVAIRTTKTFTVDGIVKEINPKTFTVDGIVKANTTKTFIVDGVVKAFGSTKTLTVDGIVIVPFSELKDNFNDNVLNTLLWNYFGYTNIFERNGHIEIFNNGFTNTETEFVSIDRYALRGSSFSFEYNLDNFTVGDGSVSSSIFLSSGLDEYLWFSIRPNTIEAYLTDSINDHLLGSIAYTGGSIFLRFRELSGTIYFDYSNDRGQTWNNIATHATGSFQINNLYFDLYHVNESTGPHTLIFDNVNYIPQVKTFTVDGIVRVLTTKTFTVDGIIKATFTSIFTVDGLVKASTNKTFTVDGVIKVATTKTFTVDGVIKVATSNIFTVDGIVKVVFTKTFTVDAIVKVVFTKTFTVDGLVKTLSNTITFTVDGVVKATQTKIFTVDAIVRVGTSAIFTVDGVIKTILTATFTVDGRLFSSACDIFADSFNRPDNTDLGTDWIEEVGDFEIKDGKLTNVTAGSNSSIRAVVNGNVPDNPNYAVSATVQSNAQINAVGLTGRASGGNFYHLRLNFNASAGFRLQLYKFTPGATILAEYDAGALEDTPYDLRLAMVGTNINGYLNGNLVISVVDGDITTTGNAGVRMFLDFGSSQDEVTIENFCVDSIDTTSFTVDGIVKEINSNIFTVDGVIRVGTSAIFTVDGIVRVGTIQVFTVDGIIVSSLSVDLVEVIFGGIAVRSQTFTVDAVVLVRTIAIFTVDGVVRTTNAFTFTVDAIILVITTATFAIDGIVKTLNNLKTFAVDAIILVATNKTFTVDGVVRETFISTFTVDAIIRVATIASFTVDGIVLVAINQTFTVDGVVKVATSSLFTVDAIVKTIVTNTFTVDGIIKTLGNIATFTVDAIVLVITQKTFTTDAIVKEINSKVFTIDGVILTQVNNTFTVDGVVLVTTTKTFTVDGIVRVSTSQVFSVDGIVRVTFTSIFTVDGIVLTVVSKTFTVDAIVKVITTTTFTVDAIVKEINSKIFTVDGVILTQVNNTFTVDAVVLATTNKTFTVDGIVRVSTSQVFSVDGIVRVTFTNTFTVDAVVLTVVTKTFTVDAIVKVIVNSTFTVDGVVRETFTNSFTVDGVIKVATSSVFTVDAIVKVLNNLKTFTVDGIIKTLSNVSTFTVDAIILVATVKTFTVDGIIFASNVSTFTVDAIVKTERNNQTFTVDAIVLKLNQSLLTVDAIVKEINTRTIVVDGIVLTVVAKTFTVDGVIRTGNSSIFTADALLVIRVNRVPNPSFEYDVPGSSVIPTDWSSYGGGVTYKGVANDWSKNRGQSFKVSNVGLADTGIRFNVTNIPIGSQVTLSAWVKSTSDVANGSMVLDSTQNGSGGSVSGANANWSGAKEERRSLTVTVDSTSIEIFLGMGSFGAPSGGTVWFDNILFEILPTVKTYFDGTFPEGGWEVVPDHSLSYLIQDIVEKTFTVDAIIRVQTVKTFTVDGLVLVATSQSFTVDAIVKVIQVKTFTVDGIVLVITNRIFTVDGIIKVATSSIFSVDGIVFATNIQTFTVDGVVQKINQLLFTVDGIVGIRTTQVFTVDAIIFVTSEIHFTIDAVIGGTHFGSPGGSGRHGLYEEDEAPKGIYEPISPIYDKDDMPVLVQSDIEKKMDIWG